MMSRIFTYILFFLVAGALAEVASNSEAEDIQEDIADDDEVAGQTIYLRKRPTCNIQGSYASCCSHIGIKKLHINGNVCLMLGVDTKRLALTGTLKWNNKDVIIKDLASARKLCVPLPPPATLVKGCIEIHHLALDIKARTIEVCPGVTLNGFVGVQFSCLKFVRGKFSINNSQKIDNPSMINVDFNNGKPHVSLHRPPIGEIMKLIPGKK